jgi:peptide/nickel transport system substrate-binding protein
MGGYNMGMKKLTGRGLYIMLVFVAAVSFLIAGFAEAAEKPAPKEVPKIALKPAAKQALKEQPQTGGILKIIEATGPKTPFGWPVEGVGEASLANKPVVESLLRQHYDGRIEPWLAESWKIAPDKSSVTLTLRKGVKFHDGTDFNAEAAKFNMEAMKAGKRPGTEDWAVIEVVDDYTLKITLTKYTNVLLTRFAGGGGAQVSPTAFKTKGIEWVRWNPVGTGPFEFVSFERDVRTKYKRFDGYWQKGKPYLDGVEYLYIKDPMTQSASMEAGEAHILNTETGKMAADLKAAGLNIITADTGTVVLIPDSTNADSPLANKKVREAIEYAIDKEAIAKTKSYGFWGAAYQLPNVGTMAYIKNFQGRRYNPAKAKQFLAEAGYPKGFKTRIIPHFAIDKDIMVIIQGYLSKVGITAEIEIVDPGKYTEYRRKGWKNGFLCQPFGSYPNYLQSLDLYFASDALDFPSMKKPAELDTLLKEALSTISPEVQRIQKVLKVIHEDVTAIPVYTTGRASIQQKNVRDTGHLSLGIWTEWTPERPWLKK